jgi:hypothetical protein
MSLAGIGNAAASHWLYESGNDLSKSKFSKTTKLTSM